MALIESIVKTSSQSENLPYWPSWLPKKLINLGLDLRGGAQVLVEVVLSDAYSDRLVNSWVSIRKTLRTDRDNIGAFRRVGEVTNNLTD